MTDVAKTISELETLIERLKTGSGIHGIFVLWIESSTTKGQMWVRKLDLGNERTYPILREAVIKQAARLQAASEPSELPKS